MKHIFVINPKSGHINHSREIEEKLKKLDGKINYEVYVTKAQRDGLFYVKKRLEERKDDEVYRFYACGGDGTLYDVVNGLYGFKNVEVTNLAVGTGNDFIKSFPDQISGFKDIDRLVNGKTVKVDLIKVSGGRYCTNIANFGFDGEVCYEQQVFKRMPFLSGSMAYYLAALNSILYHRGQQMKVTVDDKVIFEGKGLLGIAANGSIYGGGFHCAPHALIDDAIIDVCIIKKVSAFRIAKLMKVFRAGHHETDPSTKDITIYTKGKKVSFESDKKIPFAIDGEVYREPKVEMEILPLALNFVVPV